MAKAKGRTATKTVRPRKPARKPLRIEHRLCGECRAKVTFVINGKVDIRPNCQHFAFPEEEHTDELQRGSNSER